MDGHTIQRLTAERAQEFPATTVEHPFGPDWDVFKVRDKIFMVHTELQGVPIVNLKATPDDCHRLRSTYSQITPGYHMNKKHWITVRPGDQIEESLMQDLVTDSYLLVIENNLPKKAWPVNPATFAQGELSGISNEEKP